MAQVWLARSVGFGGFEKLVVLKTILPNLLGNPQFVQMFVNEARVAANLNHPNCVQIFELGKENDVLFIAMEYIEGFSLSRLMKRAKERGVRVPVEILSRVASDALSGLEYAHKLTDREGRPMELIHRDVSPDNLLVGFSGQTKVVDFGIAKARMSTMQATRAGTVKGKFGYIAPEYLRGQKIDGRADLFALGVVLYRVLTGKRPFVGDTEAAVTLSVMQQEPPTPSSVLPSLSPELSGVVMLALEKKPEARFDSARSMRLALEKAVRPAELDAVSSFLNHLWPKGDPERLALESLASGHKSEETSEPALQSIISNAYAIPTGALKTPHPAHADPMLEAATVAGVVPQGVPPPSAMDEDGPPRRSRAPLVLVALTLLGGGAGWKWLHRAAPAVEPAVAVAPNPGPPPTAPSQPAVPAPAAAAEPAKVSVDVTEPVSVLLGDKELGKAPGPFELPAGKATLKLVNRALGIDQTFEVDAQPGAVAHISELRKGSLALKVEPWAYVKLDGRSLGQTPIGKRELYEGPHVLELSNSELNVNKRIELKVKANEAKVVSLNLEE
jgi:serine/threonine-protein kinase